MKQTREYILAEIKKRLHEVAPDAKAKHCLVPEQEMTPVKIRIGMGHRRNDQSYTIYF